MSSRPLQLLVTGFGPFPGMPRNPSGSVASRLAGSPRWRLLGVEPKALVLRTAYAALPAELAPALASHPDAILMIGVAGRDPRFRVEKRATARRSRLFPDVAGQVASRPTRSRVDFIRRTTAPPAPALLAFRRRNLPSRISIDAGRYLCNAAYHLALQQPCPVLFIHIPKLPRPVRPRRATRPGRASRRPLGDRFIMRDLDAALFDIALTMLGRTRR